MNTCTRETFGDRCPTLYDFHVYVDGPPLSTDECAELLGLNVRLVRDLIDGGELRSGRVGRNFKVPWVSMRAYLMSSKMLPLSAVEIDAISKT